MAVSGVPASLKKEISKAIKVVEFQRDVDRLLTQADRDYLFYALKEFSVYKNVPILMQALESCLDTPEKLDLLPVIRDLLPKRERREYDFIAPYKKMAHPFARRRPSRSAAKFLRTVLLERTNSSESFGFSIRGGKDLGLGIYVSQVDLDTLADRGGLEVGDQLVEVNNVNFEWISHESAVMVIKAFDRLEMVLRSTRRIPELKSGMAFTW